MNWKRYLRNSWLLPALMLVCLLGSPGLVILSGACLVLQAREVFVSVH